jgi:hypothetical protein
MDKELEPRPLDDFFPILAKDESVQKLLAELYGSKAEMLIEAMASQGDIPDEFESFSDHIMDLMTVNAEYVDDFEIECLSSYSTTSDVSIQKFADIFWITNFEFGDIMYFSSEEDVRRAAEDSFGFKWPST